MDLTNDDVAEILALLDSLPYDELDLQTPRFRLTLRRTPGGWTEESQTLTEPTAVTPAPNGSGASPAPVPSTPQNGRRRHRSGARRAGRRSRAAAWDVLPGAAAGGRAVRRGGGRGAEDTVVAIVETMKLMNSVHAGTRGRVAEICLENAAPVGQGTTLMWIEPVS